MKVNSIVVRQASAPERVSPAQRWILTDFDELKMKMDASDNTVSENIKATYLPTSHDDPESTKEDAHEGMVFAFLSSLSS